MKEANEQKWNILFHVGYADVLILHGPRSKRRFFIHQQTLQSFHGWEAHGLELVQREWIGLRGVVVSSIIVPKHKGCQRKGEEEGGGRRNMRKRKNQIRIDIDKQIQKDSYRQMNRRNKLIDK